MLLGIKLLLRLTFSSAVSFRPPHQPLSPTTFSRNTHNFTNDLPNPNFSNPIPFSQIELNVTYFLNKVVIVEHPSAVVHSVGWCGATELKLRVRAEQRRWIGLSTTDGSLTEPNQLKNRRVAQKPEWSIVPSPEVVQWIHPQSKFTLGKKLEGSLTNKPMEKAGIVTHHVFIQTK